MSPSYLRKLPREKSETKKTKKQKLHNKQTNKQKKKKNLEETECRNQK